MILSLDFHNTITKNPKMFKRISGALLQAGFQVYIISALKRPTDPRRKKDVLNCKIPNSGVELVYFSDYSEIPELKLEACRRLGVKIMIDDMPSVCEKLAEEGIITLQIR